MSNEINEIEKNIKTTLESNLRAQSNLLSSLANLLVMKRELAFAMSGRHSSNCYKHENMINLEISNKSEEGYKSRKRRRSADAEKKFAKGWELNRSRKWLRRYFVDPNYSLPMNNSDTQKRRQWEGGLIGRFKTRYTPWSREDIEILTKCSEEVREQQLLLCDQNECGFCDVDIDFAKVYDSIIDKLTEKSLKPWQIKKSQISSYASNENAPLNGTIRLRRWSDYRNKYLYSTSPSINTSKFTRQEIGILAQMLGKDYSGNHEWAKIPTRLESSRTIFQCFKQIQINLNNSIGKLDAYEDELLLKYVAAAGPQFVVNHHTSTLLSQKNFPHLSPKQINSRLNTLLLNPNYRSEKWTDFEERILVLGMKSFVESVSPITKARALLPNRSGKLIVDKWCRSLNPIYSSAPFTKEEDQRLLAIAKEKYVDTGNWKFVSDLFPSRNPQTLLSRYVEMKKNENDYCLSPGETQESYQNESLTAI